MEPERNADSLAGKTEGQLQQQQKREIRELKLQAKRAGKKGQNAYKQLHAEMLARHAAEMQAVKSTKVDQIPELTSQVGAPCDEAVKKSKAQRKREKKEKQEQDEQQTIAAELAGIGETLREQEQKALQGKLQAEGLRIIDIPADGNCMYHALAHQCKIFHLEDLFGEQPSKVWHQQLRNRAAAYIEEHMEHFIPFVIDADSSAAHHDQMREYIEGVRGWAWGSQIELQALASALSVQIQVFSAACPQVDLGIEKVDGRRLQICYLEHAYSSGQHYNSVAPGLSSSESP